MSKLKAWATAPPRPWVVKYMLGFLAAGGIWLFVDNFWPGRIAFKVATGILGLYLLSLKPVLAFGPKARKIRKAALPVPIARSARNRRWTEGREGTGGEVDTRASAGDRAEGYCGEMGQSA